jgi:hypothetical protein
MVVTLEVVQLEISALKFLKLLKSSLMSVMAETSQSAMAPYFNSAAITSELYSAAAVFSSAFVVKTLGIVEGGLGDGGLGGGDGDGGGGLGDGGLGGGGRGDGGGGDGDGGGGGDGDGGGGLGDGGKGGGYLGSVPSSGAHH